MGSLMVSLRNAAGAMAAFEKAMGVVQSNVTNASTAGYARQRVEFESVRFQPEQGLSGGVQWGGTLDTRDQFTEANVRKRVTENGAADEMATQLAQIETLFDVSADSGLAGALSKLENAFSAVSVTPNDVAARQTVLDRAAQLATAFQATASGLREAGTTANAALKAQVDSINSTVAKIVEINREFRSDARTVKDAGLQAQMASLQEQLADSGDFTILTADDGSATIFLGGQVLVAQGATQYKLQVDTSQGQAALLDASGRDVTALAGGGRVGSLLQLRNSILPEHQAEMDRLAAAVADGVNTLLAGGVDPNGQTPADNLFTYDPTQGAARTLTVNPLQPQDLALADSAAPGGNAVALQLASLFQTPSIDGETFTQFYGDRAAAVGRQLQSAQDDAATKTQLVAQARQLRDSVQQVDLNEEAVLILQYQRGYEAAAKLVQTLNDMTDIAIGLLR